MLWKLILFALIFGLLALIKEIDYFPEWFKTSFEGEMDKFIINLKLTTSSDDAYYAKLSLQWPTSACIFEVIEKRRGDSPSKCRFPPQQLSWTIHGIWNAWSLGNWCSKKPLEKSDIENLTADLNQRWITVLKNNENFNFWKYQWDKHGTCFSQHPNLNTPLKYFQQAINWHRQYDPTTALIACNIIPDDTKKYSNIQVTNCLKERLNINTRIFLITKNDFTYRNGTSLLREIRICFKNTTLADCEQTGDPSYFEFVYPSTVENKSTMQYYSFLNYLKFHF